MISYNSIRAYVVTNSFLLFLGVTEYFLFILSNGNILIHFIMVLLTLLFRNYFLMYVIDSNVKNLEPIGNKIRIEPKETYFGEFNFYVLGATIVETITLLIIQEYFFLIINTDTYLSDLLFFIPISFLFEIIFDFFHYWTHRIIHKNKLLYNFLHKKHHKFQHPTSIITFYQNPFDLMITNSFPNIISIFIMKSLDVNLTFFQLVLLNVYKMYIEISGHIGKNPKSSSFVQFMWLPRLFSIELYAKNHDLHHTLNNCNYSKRFSLWDKVFGTYRTI